MAEQQAIKRENIRSVKRRDFLAALGGVALWVPGRKLISIPAPRVGHWHVFGIDTLAEAEQFETQQLATRYLRHRIDSEMLGPLSRVPFARLQTPPMGLPVFYDADGLQNIRQMQVFDVLYGAEIIRREVMIYG